MRDDQHIRRLLYFATGAVPAVALAFVALFIGNPLICAGAVIGALGLCAATLARLPPDSPDVRLPIALALVIGLIAIAPALILAVVVYVPALVNGDAAEDFTTIRGVLSYLGSALLWCWLFIGPIAVALHFLLSLRRTAGVRIGSGGDAV
jgi:hypothetical protein